MRYKQGTVESRRQWYDWHVSKRCKAGPKLLRHPGIVWFSYYRRWRNINIDEKRG